MYANIICAIGLITADSIYCRRYKKIKTKEGKKRGKKEKNVAREYVVLADACANFDQAARETIG